MRLDVRRRRYEAKSDHHACADSHLNSEINTLLNEHEDGGKSEHVGFGLGFERLVQFCTGMHNIRDVIPFPRAPRLCV